MIPHRQFWIALLSGALPLVGIHICYLVAARAGHVPWGIPYIEEVCSISKCGREEPESTLFKLFMIPAAFCMSWHWILWRSWALSRGFRTRWRLGLMCGMSLAAGAFLVAYALALGHIGPEWKLARRIGVVGYFALTALCQFLATGTLGQLVRAGHTDLKGPKRMMLLLASLLILGGVVSGFLNATWAGYEDVEDIFEWDLALITNLHFFSAAWALRSQVPPPSPPVALM